MWDVLGAVLWTSTAAMARVLVICTIGCFLERNGIVKTIERKTIASLCTVCLVPCLLFSSMFVALQSNRNVVEWVCLPLWSSMHVMIGIGTAKVFVHARKRWFWLRVCLESFDKNYDSLNNEDGDTDEGAAAADTADSVTIGGEIVIDGEDSTRSHASLEMAEHNDDRVEDHRSQIAHGAGMEDALIAVCVAFPNSGNLPMALGQSVCNVAYESTFHDDDADACSALVVGYIAIYLIMFQPLMWSLAPRILADGERSSNHDSNDPAWQQNKEQQRQEQQREPGTSSFVAHMDQATSWKEKLLGVVQRCWTKARGKFKDVPVPIWACLLGIFFGLTPPGLLASDTSWLKPAFTDALVLVGDAAIPMQILNLGSSISAKRADSPMLSRSSVFFIMFARLVLVPAFSITMAKVLSLAKVLPAENRHIIFVLMMESTSPTAMQVMVMCQLWHQGVEGMLGGLYARLYATSLITVTAWLGLILYLLGD